MCNLSGPSIKCDVEKMPTCKTLTVLHGENIVEEAETRVSHRYADVP